MKIIINGAGGRMGQEICRLANEGYRDSSLAAAVDKMGGGGMLSSVNDFAGEADVIIDFSHHTAAPEVAEYAAKRGIALVMATTGHTDDELAAITEASKSVPVFMSANMSLGVALLAELAKKTAKAMPDAEIEIIEKHHNRKLDAPSGTALLLAEAIRTVRKGAKLVFGRYGQGKRDPDEIGIHAIRMGNIVGDHEIIVGTDTQTITLRHEAHSRALFAEGAICAAEFLIQQPAGLYNMQDFLNFAD
jgi:4-hydroxy-tetrahydrodipicolinate reductase